MSDRRWKCVVYRTITTFIPWRCEFGSSMAPGHENCDWVDPTTEEE